jgi:hypothetical protein
MKRLLISLVILSLLLAGCSAGSAKDEAGNDIATYANPLADNLIAGILTRDYATFSKDFDEAMLTGIPESGFQELLKFLDERVGACTSHELTQTSVANSYPIAIYTLQCENSKKGVFVKVVMTPEEPHKVTGLYFDGAELR